MRKSLLLLMTAVLAMGLTLTAGATTITQTITLNNANADLATQGSGPYGQVVISSTNGKDWTAVASGLNNFVFIGNGAFALNLVETSVTGTASGYSCLTGTSCSLSETFGSPTNEDGFGSFDFRFSAPDASNGNRLKGFTINFSTSSTYTSVTGVGGLLAFNGVDGSYAAGHMALGGGACTGYAGTPGTGGTSIGDAVNCTTSTPEPGSLMLLSAGLLGLGGLIRRRNKK